jgi:hypothetical protein
MLTQLQQLGQAAARAATVELGQRSLGAINEVTLDSVDLLRDEDGAAYYVLRFVVHETGISRGIPMAWLPEFMDGEPDVEWYVETMCSFIIEQALGEDAGLLGEEEEEDEGLPFDWDGAEHEEDE